jgi:hypothetical protein
MSVSIVEFQRPKPGQEVLGGNGPPNDAIDGARDSCRLIKTWLRNNPAVVNESDAYAANEVLVIAENTLAALKGARDAECTPLRKIWEEARARWATPIESVDGLKTEVTGRLQPYMLAEEDRRKAEAAEARRIAAEAEAAAREAERMEAEARQNASLGEFVDVVQASEDADQAFGDYRHAHRAAVIAEKSVPVRLKSRFDTKATKLRTKRTLVVDDVPKALDAIGITDRIMEAILMEARQFKKDFGTLPDGISEVEERGL